MGKHRRAPFVFVCRSCSPPIFPNTSCHAARTPSPGCTLIIIIIISAHIFPLSSLYPLSFSHSPFHLPLLISRDERGVSMATRERWRGGGGRRRRRRRGEGAASFGNLMLHGWKVQRKYVTPTSRRPAECARQMDLQGNYQWLMRSALFNCTNAILSP